MSETDASFVERLRARFADTEISVAQPRGEVGIVFDATAWHDGCRALRDEFGFEQLIDVCGVDHLGYGSDEWDTDVSSEGFSRGVEGKGPGRFKFGEVPRIGQHFQRDLVARKRDGDDRAVEARVGEVRAQALDEGGAHAMTPCVPDASRGASRLVENGEDSLRRIFFCNCRMP